MSLLNSLNYGLGNGKHLISAKFESQKVPIHTMLLYLTRNTRNRAGWENF